MGILNRYWFCHFIPVFRVGEVQRAECFGKLYITIIALIIARKFLKECKDFLFIKERINLEVGSKIINISFHVCPFINLYFCLPVSGYFPNLTIFSCPHLGHIIFKNHKKVNTTPKAMRGKMRFKFVIFFVLLFFSEDLYAADIPIIFLRGHKSEGIPEVQETILLKTFYKSYDYRENAEGADEKTFIYYA